MNRLFHDTFHPEIYHGRNRHAPFFEGWYFKIVDADSDFAWAIIPGIYKGKENGRDEAFIMTLDGRTHKSTFHSFPIDSFQADERIFDIRIGEKNRFRSDGLTLDLPELSGSVSFSGVVSWPVSWISPGIMGPFAYFPLECYHGTLHTCFEIIKSHRCLQFSQISSILTKYSARSQVYSAWTTRSKASYKHLQVQLI